MAKNDLKFRVKKFTGYDATHDITDGYIVEQRLLDKWFLTWVQRGVYPTLDKCMEQFPYESCIASALKLREQENSK